MAHSAPRAFHGTAKELSSLVADRDDAVVAAACRICADAANCFDGPGVNKANICERLKVLCVEGTRAQAKHATRALSKLAAAEGAGKDHLRRVFESIVEAAGGRRTPRQQPARGARDCASGGDARARPLPGASRGRGVLRRGRHPRATPAEAQVALRGKRERRRRDPRARHEASRRWCCRLARARRRGGRVGARRRPPRPRRLREVLDAADDIGSGADLAHLRVGAAKATLVVARADHTSVSSRAVRRGRPRGGGDAGDLIEKVRRGVVTKHGLNHAYAAPLALVAGCGKGEAKSEAKEALASVIAHARRRAAAVKAAAVGARTRTRRRSAARSSRTRPSTRCRTSSFSSRTTRRCPTSEDGEVDCGAAYRPFQYAASALVAALTAGTSGESVPAACKILRKLKSAADAVDEDASHGMHVLADILLLVLHKEATRRGWDTGAFPGQVAFPRAYFTLQQTSATNGSGAEGARARAGDYSHLPPGFEVKTARRSRRGGDGTARARAPKKQKQTAGRAAKPAAEPSRLMPSRAARKAAIVDDDEEYDEEEEEEGAIVPAGNEMVTPGVAKLVSYGIRNEVPMLELPAPPDWGAATSTRRRKRRRKEEEEDEEAPTVEEEPLATIVGRRQRL